MLDRIDASIDKFKQATESVKEIKLDPENIDEILAVVDQRIDAATAKLRQELALERKSERFHALIILVANICIATLTIVTAVVQRYFW